MRPRLVFIDDDAQELDDFGRIVSEEYDYTQIVWPMRGSLDHNIGKPPAIFVLDLYFPPANAGGPATISEASRTVQTARAEQLSRRIARLYEGSVDGQRLLRDTFSCIDEFYELLWAQCFELQQSPQNGRKLLAELKSHPKYRKIPVVVYSRKVTVQEAVRALQAGAAAVIPKVSSPPSREERESVLSQIKTAQALARLTWQTRIASWMGGNVNITLLQQEFVQQKAEIVAVKLGG